MAQPFTKKHMADIKESDDTFDKEYFQRLQRASSNKDLFDLLEDYEEFLPYQLQKFKDAPPAAIKELVFQCNRLMRKIVNGEPVPMEPSEAIMILQPPLLRVIRDYATKWTEENPGKKPMTWGAAFVRFAHLGLIPKMEAMINAQMQQIIDVKEENQDQISEWVDTKG